MNRSVMIPQRRHRGWIGLPVGILVLGAAGKAWELCRDATYLSLPDPALPQFSTRQAMWIALIVEVAVAASLAAPIGRRLKGMALMWLAAVFGVYHVMLQINRPGGVCKCLGAFLDWLHLGPQVTSGLVYLAVGGLFAAGFQLFRHAISRGPESVASSITSPA